jgi:hypothetical protein
LQNAKTSKSPPPSAVLFPPKRISFSLFEPFNFLLSEVKDKPKCQKNKVLAKIRPKKSTSEPSDDPWLALYKLLKPLFYGLIA